MASGMSRRERKAIARAAQEAKAALSAIDYAVVTAVDAEAGEATVVLSDGTKTTIYKNVGVLPGVDDMVPGVRNGGDFVPIGGRHWVDGALVSGGGFDPDADQAWGLWSDGILRCLGAVIEGSVTAREFRTRADFTAEGGIQIDSEAYNRILLRRPGTLEDFPARITADTGSGMNRVRIVSGSDGPGTPASLTLVKHPSSDYSAIYGATDPDGEITLGVGFSVMNLSAAESRLQSLGVVELVGSAVNVNGRPVKAESEGRFTGTTNGSGQFTISHGLGATAIMTVAYVWPTVMTYAGSHIQPPRVISSTGASTTWEAWGAGVLLTGFPVTVDWQARVW